MLGFGALFTLQACFHHGTTVESFPPARTPKGVTGQIKTTRADYTVELIEVRDGGIVILSAQTLRFLPYSAITSSRFDGIGDSISNRKSPSPKVRERLRLLSRFPPGLTPELLQTLLTAHAQTQLVQENP
jgi:DNA-binding transcriptional LysR family regulator